MKKGNGEGSIYTTTLNGKKYYRAQITVGFDSKGKPVRKSFSGYKKADVVEKMNKALYELNNNLFVEDDKTKFGEFFKNWIFTYKKIELKPNSFEIYESAYRLKIKPFRISNMKVQDIKTLHLQRYFNDLLDDNVLTANSAKTLLIQIKACFDFAISQDIIIKNPAKNIKLPKIKKETNKIKVFSKEEQNLIINNLTDDTIDTIDFLIKFDFATGLRLGEILALKWEDLENNLINIKRQYQYVYEIDEDGSRVRTYKFTDLKTESSKRSITIPAEILKELKNYKLNQSKYIMKYRNIYNDNNLIFADNVGNPIERKKPNRRLQKICTDIGIEPRPFHSIRHSYATRLFELAIPIKTVQVLMGHSDIATTMDIYTHVMQEQKEEASSKLNQLFL